MRTEENIQRLQKLLHLLQRLVAMLRLDTTCSWTSKFESDLDFCGALATKGFSESELADLSNSITHVFQGMGSFNDYSPAAYNAQTGRYLPIPGTEDFEAVAKEVFNLAVDLRRHD